MNPPLRHRYLLGAIAALAAVAIAFSLVELRASRAGVGVTTLDIGTIPATIFRPVGDVRPPVVVIAHGFAGSQQLMQSFALTLARNGYIAVTFDFAGHGRNPSPLIGSITDASGATQTLLAELMQVAGFARGLGDGRLAVLGHSMASDIVVRYAAVTPDVAATIAVSMFSPAVTGTSPPNLLVIVGEWESALKREALRAVGMAASTREPSPGVTYGDFAAGTARRAAFSAHVEHVGVLFSETSLREALDWVDRAFGKVRSAPPAIDQRGPWIMVLMAAALALAFPSSALLPRIAPAPLGARLRWNRLWPVLLVPMLATPLVLRLVPTHVLPVLVGDYLAAHFAVYGLITAGCLIRIRAPKTLRPAQSVSTAKVVLATWCVVAFVFVALVWPINSFFTSFVPGAGRLLLIAAMLVGTSLYFVSDEWATRGDSAGRWAYPASKLAFLLSLAFAVALDFEHLFFLIIIVPIIMLSFVVYGSLSALVYARTGYPVVAGIANAIAFAWAIGVTFPLLAG